MKKVISTERIPIKLWLDNIEEEALDQAKNLANLPFAYKWIALMPDTHVGFGMPIGGVLANDGMIIPHAVGVDIGCGMCAVKTSLKEIDIDILKKIMDKIRKVIPLGFNKHKEQQDIKLMPYLPDLGQVAWQEKENALKSLGTLGGGNHFIEIQKGSDGHIWIMVHSGSRNLGLKVANYYNDLAVKLNEKWHSKVPKSWELAFLPLDSEEGQNYLIEMQYCVDFALANRQLMMTRICEIVKKQTGCDLIDLGGYSGMINIAHNYASMENHFGKNVMVHRKGATKATKGLTGIIPGSMGTPSYIVEGLGNKDSFDSCSHGAGRKMGRKEAQKTLNLEEEQKKMTGIVHGLRDISNLDEAPGSYKNIDEVITNQADLVKVKVKLTPLASIKG